jgi:hypothetical protein
MINLLIGYLELLQSAKYEFASSNTTRTMFAFLACFVWKLAPLADERSGYFIENYRDDWRDRARIKRCKLVLGLLNTIFFVLSDVKIGSLSMIAIQL